MDLNGKHWYKSTFIACCIVMKMICFIFQVRITVGHICMRWSSWSVQFCTEGLHVTLFDAFGVPLFDCCSLAWKFSATSNEGRSWISSLLSFCPWGGIDSEVSQSFASLDIFDLAGFWAGSAFGADVRNCSVSWARPVISDLHFGHTLEGRPSLKIKWGNPNDPGPIHDDRNIWS